MCKKRHRDVFYAWNGRGPWECVFCGELVYAWWDRGDADERDAVALAIHHKNHNHDDNRPENLQAAHYGCHTRHHRQLRPLVAKGSKLPDEWRERIAASSRARVEGWSDEDKAEWLSKVLAGMSRVDKTPMMCECGAGPFKGEQGLNIHRARGNHK